MAAIFEVTLNDGIPVSGDGEVMTINALAADGGMVTIGAKADAANTATNATPISAMSIWKQISKSLQALVALWPTALGVGGGIKVDGSGTALPVSLASVPSHAVTNSGTFKTQSAGGRGSLLSVTPAASAYLAGDAVGVSAGSAIQAFASACAGAGEHILESVQLLINRNAVISGETSYRLHLFNASPTAIADNAPFDLASADISKYLGYVDIPNVADMGSVVFSQANNVGLRFTAASATLYGVLVTVGPYTPTAVAYTTRLFTREA